MKKLVFMLVVMASSLVSFAQNVTVNNNSCDGIYLRVSSWDGVTCTTCYSNYCVGAGASVVITPPAGCTQFVDAGIHYRCAPQCGVGIQVGPPGSCLGTPSGPTQVATGCPCGNINAQWFPYGTLNVW